MAASCGTSSPPSAAPSSTESPSTAASPTTTTTTTTPSTTTTVATTTTADRPIVARRALVDVKGTLTALSPSGGPPAWTLAEAVASADGASAYRVEGGPLLVRFDTARGVANGRWSLPAGGAWRVVVVSPDGTHVVLTDGVIDSDHRPATTRLIVWSSQSPDQPRLVERPGALQPEALSPDGRTVFLLDHHSTYYRVRILDLLTSELYDSIGRDKSPAEDMYGHAVHAVLSADGLVLSTLYRVADLTQKPFVHVLYLAGSWSYCADLPPGDYTSIASSLDGRTVYVGAANGSWITIDVSHMSEVSSDALPMVVHPASTPPVPLAVGGSLVTADATVTADAAGVTWYRNGALLAHVSAPIARLVALVPA